MHRTAQDVWKLFADSGQTRFPLGRWGVPVDVRERQFEKGTFAYDHSCEYRDVPAEKRVCTIATKHNSHFWCRRCFVSVPKTRVSGGYVSGNWCALDM